MLAGAQICTLRTLKAGDHFGDLELLMDQSRTATVVSKEVLHLAYLN